VVVPTEVPLLPVTPIIIRVIPAHAVVEGALHFLGDRILAVVDVEIVDMHALALLLADQHPIEVGDLPQLTLHFFPRREDQLEFSEQFLVLTAVLLVVF
jgi:hypothetical protein